MKVLIKGIQMLRMIGEEEGIIEGDIAIDGSIIAAVGCVSQEFEKQADRIIDGSGLLAIPGLINAHTHTPMSLLRNYGSDLELMDWLNQKIFPAEDRMDEESAYYGALLSIGEMIRSGCTAFADMYMFEEQIVKAALSSGVRANVSKGLVGDGESEDSLSRLERNKWLYDQYNGEGDGRIKVDFGPHAPYTCGDALFVKVAEAAAQRPGAGIHVHLSETRGEVENSIRQFGMTPTARLEKLGLFDSARVIAAHCVHLCREDLEFLSSHNVTAVHNPSSNLKLASGFAPVGTLLEHGIPVALGTDGSSSNNNQNVCEELHLAAVLAKAAAQDAKILPAYQAMELATTNGAKALGREDQIGSIEVGKQADLALINIRQLHWTPHTDLTAALVYSMCGSDVDTVICDGKLLMENKRLLTIDEEKVMAEVEARVKKVLG